MPLPPLTFPATFPCYRLRRGQRFIFFCMRVLSCREMSYKNHVTEFNLWEQNWWKESGGLCPWLFYRLGQLLLNLAEKQTLITCFLLTNTSLLGLFCHKWSQDLPKNTRNPNKLVSSWYKLKSFYQWQSSSKIPFQEKWHIFCFDYPFLKGPNLILNDKPYIYILIGFCNINENFAFSLKLLY